MRELSEKALEAAWLAHDNACPGEHWRKKDRMEVAIRAYLSAAVSADVVGLVERLNHVKAHSNSASVHEICDDSAAALVTLAAESARLRKINADHCRTVNTYIVDNARRDDARREAEARAESAEAEIARLRDAIAVKDKALEPFAEAASVFDNTGGSLYAALSCIRPNDLRAARRAHRGQADG